MVAYAGASEAQAYGNMRATLGVSATETSTIRLSLDLVWFDLLVRMWRIFVWPRLNLPLAVFLKRLAAPEWVFIFGMGTC